MTPGEKAAARLNDSGFLLRAKFRGWTVDTTSVERRGLVPAARFSERATARKVDAPRIRRSPWDAWVRLSTPGPFIHRFCWTECRNALSTKLL